MYNFWFDQLSWKINIRRILMFLNTSAHFVGLLFSSSPKEN